MTKKKSGKALFEVITTYRQKHPGTGPLMPEWMRRREQPSGVVMPELTPVPLEPQPVAPAPVQAAAVVKPPPVARPVRQARLEPIHESTLEPLGEPMVGTARGRLTLSLNYVTSVVAALGLVLLLVAAFLLGRVTASGQVAAKPAATPTPDKPVKPNETPVPGRTNNVVPERPKATSGLFAEDLARGKFYFVIQVIQNTASPEDEKKQEADKIARFCSNAPAGKAVPATRALYVTQDGSRRWLVVATEPFESNEKNDRVKKLEEKAEALGADPANPTLYKFKLEKTLVIRNEG